MLLIAIVSYDSACQFCIITLYYCLMILSPLLQMIFPYYDNFKYFNIPQFLFAAFPHDMLAPHTITLFFLLLSSWLAVLTFCFALNIPYLPANLHPCF